MQKQGERTKGMTEIKPRIDENGEPICSGGHCPFCTSIGQQTLCDVIFCNYYEFEKACGVGAHCLPAICQQRDEAQSKLAKWNNQVQKLEHELKEKTELAARLMEEAERWKEAAGALSLATLLVEGQEAAFYFQKYLQSNGWDSELTKEACMEEAEDIKFTLDNHPRGFQ